MFPLSLSRCVSGIGGAALNAAAGAAGKPNEHGTGDILNMVSKIEYQSPLKLGGWICLVIFCMFLILFVGFNHA